jgi:hypothetical protein
MDPKDPDPQDCFIPTSDDFFLTHIDGLLFLPFLLDDRRIRIRAVRLTIGSGSRRPQTYGSYAFGSRSATLFYSLRFASDDYFLTHIDVGLPDEALAAHGLLGLGRVDEDGEVPLRVRGHEAQVTVVDDELAGVGLQRTRVFRDHGQRPAHTNQNIFLDFISYLRLLVQKQLKDRILDFLLSYDLDPVT